MSITIEDCLGKAVDAFEIIQVERKHFHARKAGNNGLRSGGIASAYRHTSGPIKRQMLVQWLRTVGERFREANVDLPWIAAEGQFP
ncbi:hypothetical protein KBA01_19350 [Kozakia baliensis]|nr:hypothetical protein KBA01_19350 [Kozakia baliensis]